MRAPYRRPPATLLRLAGIMQAPHDRPVPPIMTAVPIARLADQLDLDLADVKPVEIKDSNSQT